MHFDVDVIDFSDVPLSENTGRGIGVSFDAALAALGILVAHDALLGLTVTELNPTMGPTTARTSRAWRGRWRPSSPGPSAVAQASELASTTPSAKGAASATAKVKIRALDSDVPRAT